MFVCTCNTWHLSEEQSMFSQGWYIPRVMQFNKITIILTRSNHVETTALRRTAHTERQIMTQHNMT